MTNDMGVQRSDEAGIKRAAQQAVQASSTETSEMTAFLEALDDYGLFCAEDAIACGTGHPGGVPRDPDYWGTEQAVAKVVEAARKAFAPSAPAAQPKQEHYTGLLRVWDWNKRGAL